MGDARLLGIRFAEMQPRILTWLEAVSDVVISRGDILLY